MKHSDDSRNTLVLVLLILYAALLAMRLTELLFTMKKYRKSKKAIIESEAEETEKI